MPTYGAAARISRSQSVDSEEDPRSWLSADQAYDSEEDYRAGLLLSPGSQARDDIEWCIAHDVDHPLLAAAREAEREAAWEEDQEFLNEELADQAQWVETVHRQLEEEAEFMSFHRAMRREQFYRSQSRPDKSVWKHHLKAASGVIDLR